MQDFQKIRLIIFIGLLLRVLCAVWAFFYGNLPGASSDAMAFHEEALQLQNCDFPHGLRVAWLYSDLLGCVYAFTYPDQLVGAFLSILFWLLSVLCINKILEHLGVDTVEKLYALIIYTLIPSSIFFSSVTLRESLQSLGVYLFILSALKIYNKKGIIWILALLFSYFFTIFLHKTFAISFFLIIFIIFIFYLYKKYIAVKFNAIAIVFLLIILFYSYWGDSLNVVVIDQANGWKNFRRILILKEGRADYGIDPYSLITVWDHMLYMLNSFIQYFIEPLPFRIEGLVDLECFFENMIRLYFIISIIYFLSIRNILASVDERIILVSYLIIEFIWSLGTTNWGTAWRHHYPAFGLLLILYYSLKCKSTYCEDRLRR